MGLSVGAAAAVGVVLGGGSAGADSPVGYDGHAIMLSTSQTAVVANNNLGGLFAGVPYVPNLIYNPGWGRSIQLSAANAASRGGCIEIGIATPRGASGAPNLNYVTTYPAALCAR
ncbi:hypothetical protein ACLTEW_25005 [Gordonia lacunae]|uniref:hypothetical protein n=1 Tax=Gordonia lacunae TaxID=417102 RepID=UPI0039E4A2CF